MDSSSLNQSVALLCKRGQNSVGVMISQGMGFQALVMKLVGKWKDLMPGSFSLSYAITGHSNCMLDSDDDLDFLYGLALTTGVSHVDVDIKESTGSTFPEIVSAPSCSSVTVEHCIVSVDIFPDVDKEGDLVSSYCGHRKKVLKSDGWAREIEGVDQVFRGGTAFRDSLSKYSLFHGFQFYYARNDGQTIKACCRNMSCSWLVVAKGEKPSGVFRIKEFIDKHSCGASALSTSSSRSTSGLMGRLLAESKISTPKGPAAVRKEMKRDYGMEVSYRKAWLAVEKAKIHNYGDYTKSFKELKWFVDAFRSSDPNSTCDLEWDECSRFKRLFVGFGACKYGFSFCRPLLFVDGTFLKGTHKGCLLSACTKDGNRGLYPICIAVVDSENNENWLWFTEKLRDFLQAEREVVFVSDRNEGLLRAVDVVFPSSPHSYCLVHLKANLKKCMGGVVTKKKQHVLNLFHSCAYAPTVAEFDKVLTRLKKDGGVKVVEFLSRLPNEHWAHPYFPGKRYGELTSNLVESFNNWIKKERWLPITQLVDRIRLKMMNLMSERRDASKKWKSVICPLMDRKLGSLFGLSKDWVVITSTAEVYEVLCDPRVRVDIGQRSCSCGEWQINSFPCVHGVCAIKASKTDLNDYVEHFFHTKAYCETYSKSINPVPTIWKSVDVESVDGFLLPPACKRPPGRPRTERIPSTGVKTRKTTCGRCGKSGFHNRATCKSPLHG